MVIIMNLIKGFNRLFIVLAVISMLPGFMLGYSIYENFKTIDWQSPNTIIRYKDFFDGFTQKEIIDYKMPVPPEYRAMPRSAAPYADRYEIKNVKFLPPVKYCIFWGVIGSLLSFLSVLCILKGIMFIIQWITVGFKD
jgi:hypothetical protein